MDWREYFNDGEEFQGFLQELIDDGSIDGAMRGMAVKVIRGGVLSLTSGQAYIFKTELIDQYPRQCRCCQREIPWNEVVCANMFNEGYCGDCAYSMSKDLA